MGILLVLGMIILGLLEDYGGEKRSPSDSERASLQHLRLDGKQRTGKDKGLIYYGPGDLVAIRPNVPHSVNVPNA